MSESTKTCNKCNGYGHDKAGRPVIKFEDRVRKDGTKYKQHVTVCQGSGCLKCGGIGKVPV